MQGRRFAGETSALRGVYAALRAATLEDATTERLFRVCCEALRAEGLPIERAYLAFRVLHPLFQAKSFVWEGSGRLVEDRHVTSAADPASPFRSSPQYHLLSQREPSLRRRLRGPEASLDFPVLGELAAEGMSDYRAFVARFGRGADEGLVGSWTLAAPESFSEADLALLEEAENQLAVLMKAAIKEEIARALVDTYLGGDAGRRVLAGGIRRGDADEIEAVIWYADLRDSSRHAERLGPAGYLALLDRYFEAVAAAIAEAGGQILLLIGDAVLAIFPIEPADAPALRSAREAAACRAALAAAAEARDRLAAGNAERPGEPPLACGLSLHVGRFLFGNIGVPERLQFTAVGPAVNLAARLEDLCKRLEEPLLASAAFAGALPEVSWRGLGGHALRGLEGLQQVYAPPIRAPRF
ncbi:MAG: adenylate/guanylate cyclase domain-containing protein [Tistlia sp.]|uniref:adenylate/guanylate cyclase domain-containing protein n=1 Tax=Tistlia sp. TaxID=3057121 RepID=UPI0034A1B9FD